MARPATVGVLRGADPLSVRHRPNGQPSRPPSSTAPSCSRLVRMAQVPDSRVKLNVRVLPLVILLLLVLRALAPFRAAAIALLALGGALGVGYLWTLSLATGLRLSREMRFGWAQVGDRIEERFKLVNRSPLPALWAEVVDRSTMPGYDVSRVSTLGGQETTHWRSQGSCGQRGVFTLGPTSLRFGDPLGIFSGELRYSRSVPFVVVPPIISLLPIDVASRGRTGAGFPRPNTPGRTVSAAAVREYHPGDNPRWIHWRTSARRESLHVRLFDSVPVGDWWIMLDMYEHVQAGTGFESTDEHGVVIAASLADRGLRAGRQVGLAAWGRELAWLPPRRGEVQRWEILRALAVVRRGETPLARMLAESGPLLGHRFSLILITPDLGAAWIDALLPLVRQDIVPTVLLVDRALFGRAVKQRAASSPRAQQAAAMLAELGIGHRVIGQSFLDRSELAPGTRGQWEWRVLGTGHAIPVRRPTEAGWKAVSG